MVKQQQCLNAQAHQASQGLCCTECCAETEYSSFCNHEANLIKISKADFIGDPLSVVRKMLCLVICSLHGVSQLPHENSKGKSD